jgi:Phosphotransferase enzyme family
MAIATRWFEAAVRPDHVRSVLAHEIPEFASGQMTLLSCEIKRLRSAEPEGFWTATYLLTVAEPSSGPRTLSAHGLLIPPGAAAPAPVAVIPLGTDGWECYVSSLRLRLRIEAVDAALPALALLTEPDEARTLIEGILRESDAGMDELRLAGVNPQVMDHKLGVRCTVLCHLEYSADLAEDELGPEMVVAKLQLDEEGARTYAAMQTLWDSPLGKSEHVSIARPLAYTPELGLLIQSAVPEQQNLKEFMHAALLSEDEAMMAELAQKLRMTARGLADLHGCGARHGGFVTWSEELSILRAKQAKLVSVMPMLADVTGSVFERLLAAATTAPPDPFVPVHHSFRPAQVLLANGSMAFIDFDKSCQSEAASDLAMFTTKVRHASLNKLRAGADDEDDDEALDVETRLARIARADRLCEMFIAEYEQHAPVSRRRIALWEALELYSLILSAAKKVKPGRVDNCAFMLEEHLRRNGL